MEKMVLDVPSLWADHHVLKVREALTSLEGVEDVYASSAWKQVLVRYDDARTDRATVERALAEAGYPVGEGGELMLVQPTGVGRDPRWAIFGVRVTKTNQSDLALSGEFRKY